MARPRRRAPEGRQNAGERPEKGRCAFDKVVHNGSGRRRSGVRRAACVPCTMGGSAAPVSVRTHLKRRHGRRDVLAWAALASRHARSKVQRRTAVARDAWRGTANGLFPSSVGWILPHPQAPPGVARLSRSSRRAGLGEVGRPTANGQRPTANGQRPTANGQRPTANGQRHGAPDTSAPEASSSRNPLASSTNLRPTEPRCAALTGARPA